MSRIYLDACTVIYLVEAVRPFHTTVIDKLAAHRSEPESRLLTSRLSRLECRVRPLQEKNTALLGAYDEFFSKERLLVIDITGPIIEHATELRARYRFKTPDAIHLATAIDQKADVFYTGDADLLRCAEIKVETLA